MIHRTPGPSTLSRAEAIILIICAGLIIAPLAMTSWAALALAAVSFQTRCEKSEGGRAAAEILIVSAARVPVTTLALGVLSEPLLKFDAWSASTLLTFVAENAQLEGNMIFSTQGHALLIMTGCTSYANIGYALLLWFAVTRPFSKTSLGVRISIAVSLAAAIASINIIRLAIMAKNEALFTSFHDGLGADAVEFAYAVSVAIATAVTFAAQRTSRPR